MFVYNDARTDSRVWREAGALTAAGHEVTVIAVAEPGFPHSEMRSEGRLVRVGGTGVTKQGTASPFLGGPGGLVGRADWLRTYASTLRRWQSAAVAAAVRHADSGQPIVWHGHDLQGLMVAVRARKRHPGAVVYDSHELFMEAGSAARLPQALRVVLGRYERLLARGSDRIITVNESIADVLAQRFDVPRPTVVMNCPPLGTVPGDRLLSPLRTELELGTRPVVLYHGAVSPDRGILETARALEHLPAEIAVVVLGDGDLVPELTALTAQSGYRGRLFLHPSVPFGPELARWVAGADVGVIAFPPIERNNVLATPNKLFECLAAGVPVVTSDFPEMRRIVESDDLGTTCDPVSPASIAAGILRVLADDPIGSRIARRARCRSAAERRYSWEHESAGLIALYNGLLEAELSR